MSYNASLYASNTPVGFEKPACEATIFIATSLLSFAPLVILGSAIGWPASLDNPAAQQLAAVAGVPQAVALGYGVYLLYSVLVLPVMVLCAQRVFGGLATAGATLVVAFAALSVIARSVGILRWLTVMPELAQQHAVADAAQRDMIELVFNAVTTWGGGVGELLGVSVFMALSLGVAMAVAWSRRSLPRWLAALGLAAAVLLLGLFAPAIGAHDILPVAVAVSALSLWMLAFGGWLLWTKQPI